MADTEVDFFEETDDSNASEAFKNKLTRMANEVKSLEDQISALQSQIADLAKRKSDLETREIPDALMEAGVRTFTTLEGITVSTKFVVGSIPAEKKEAAYQWLDEHGHSSIIKRGVSVKFDKGSEEAAEKAAEQLRVLGLDPKVTLDIHPQTFMSFAREQINKGVVLPLVEWGVFHGEKAVIK